MSNYAAEILALGPDAYWRLGEASGVAAINAANPGTYDGVYTPNAGGVWTKGTLGQPGPLVNDATSRSAYFNGPTYPSSFDDLGGGQVTVGNVLNPENDSYSVVAWFRRANLSLHQSGRYIAAKGAVANPNVWAIGINTSGSNGLLQVWCSNGDVSNAASMRLDVKPPHYILDTDWHMVAMSIDRDANSLFAWLDGDDSVFEIYSGYNSDLSNLGYASTPYPITIGCTGYNGGLRYFNGDIAEVSIFKGRALTGAEIQRLYRCANFNAAWAAGSNQLIGV